MNELEKLFGSSEKVKLIRLFLANQDKFFQLEDIVRITKLKNDKIRKELNNLISSSLVIKSKEKMAKLNSLNGKKLPIKEYTCYKLNKDFRFLSSLKNLVFDFKNANIEALYNKFKILGKTKLFLVSGVFTSDEKARVDIMYVGESIKKNLIDKILSDLKAEVGIDLNVAIFDVEEFMYRHKMFDKLVRDILNSRNIKFINKLNF